MRGRIMFLAGLAVGFVAGAQPAASATSRW